MLCPATRTRSLSAPAPAARPAPGCWPATAATRSWSWRPGRTTGRSTRAGGPATCSTPSRSRSRTTGAWSRPRRRDWTCPAPASSAAARPTTAARSPAAPGPTTTAGPRPAIPAGTPARASPRWTGPPAGNPGGDAGTVEPLLDWAHDRFRVRRYRMAELTVAQAAFVRAGVHTGLPFADDLDDLEAGPGIGPMPVNIAGGVRWNAAFAFLDPVRDRASLSIAGRTHVRRVLLSGGAVTGAEVTGPDGRAATIRAGRVIVAAGAYHSPALLQRSGIGAADQLRGLGLEVVADRPGVGQHLLDHACVELDFTGRGGLAAELAARPWNPDEQTVGRARSARCDDGPYDIHVFMVAGANSGHPG